MLTKALVLEPAPRGIIVNAVAPGSIKTPGTKTWGSKAIENGLTIEQLTKGSKGRIPLGCPGEPDDIARVVLFAASAAADYMTGSVLIADGEYLLS